MCKAIYLTIYLFIYLAISLNGQVLNRQEIEKGTSIQRNATYNLEEIKVRWKKAALENCTGVPCIVTPPFTCGTTVSDIDGNAYNTVLIGAQCWTKENLRVRRYNNGTAIPFDATGGAGGSSSTWQNLRIGAHTIYAHDSLAYPSNRTNYGYLYNWYAAKGMYTPGTILPNDTLNICPSGWHVPTDAEWTTLINELGGESVAGGKMKSVRTFYWNSPNEEATNESGFSALPGGFRIKNGSFNNLRYSATFWSLHESSVDYYIAWLRRLDYNSDDVFRISYEKEHGASIRCLKD